MPEYFDHFSSRHSIEADATADEEFSRKYNIPSLARLEATVYALVSSRSRCLDSVPWQEDIMSMVNGYLRGSGGTIFGRYYGYLLVRYYIHLSLLEMFQRTAFSEEFHESLAKLEHYEDKTQAMAMVLVEKIGVTSREQRKEALIVECGRAFEGGILLSLLRSIWEDRGSFLTLCARGCLPGSAAILFGFYSWVPGQSEHEHANYLIMITELYLRLFLVGSNRDRQIPLVYSSSVLDRIFSTRRDFNFFDAVDKADEKALIQAHSDLVFTLEHNLEFAHSLSIDTLSLLCHCVNKIPSLSCTSPVNDLAKIFLGSLRYFWIVLCRPCIPGAVTDTLYMMTRTLAMIEFTCKRRGGVDEWVQMLLDCDYISMIGRALMLGIQFGDGVAIMEWICVAHDTLKPGLVAFTRSSHQLFQESILAWLKLFSYLNLTALGLQDCKLNPRFVDFVRAVMKVWRLIGLSLVDKHCILGWECANPRCCLVLDDVWTPLVRYQCDKCRRVTYCSIHCQRIHWNEPGGDSHMNKCLSVASGR
ncbi:MYND Zn-finger protein [Ceratobasidium sp. AG-Ba]|nr:MYND Zn-finger protein [Ceratobasidium sp. AG-Ba]